MLGHGNCDAFFTYSFRPGFGFCKPSIRWRIGSSLKECYRQHIVHGLVIRERRMQPKPVAGLQTRHFGDRQSLARPRNLHLHPGSGEVKRIISIRRTTSNK